MIRRILLGATTALVFSALAGCQSSEEKAEAHYKSGMELLEKGDTDRALVEFRNVFQLNGRHREARKTYARLMVERGNAREAYGQYLRLVEQYPDDFDGNMALAGMAMKNGAWDDSATYARRAAQIDPASPEAKAMVMIIDYRDAFVAKNDADMARITAEAAALLKDNPNLSLLRKFLIDEAMRTSDFNGALALADAGIALDPGYDDFYPVRLAALYQLGETDKITDQLKAMVARKPDDQAVRNMLIGWYVSQKDTAAAEAEMRTQVDPAKDDLDPEVRLIQFLLQVKGRDAARAEIEAVLAARPDSAHRALYQSMLAGFDFDDGKRDAAIAAMEKIVADNPKAPELNRIRVGLAKMMSQVGNEVGARATVEQILAAEPANAEALKLKAGWLIEDDKTGDALIALRTALEQSPRDPEVMTLMARAHEREGNTDLMSDMLAQAVEASGQAPEESLRYAVVLQSKGKLLPAEDVLVNALRRQPDEPRLLGALGGLYVQMKDWARADHVVRTLEGAKDESARRMGQELQARLLAASGQEDELTQFLSSMGGQTGGPGPEMLLVRDALNRGKTDDALAQVVALRAKYPDLPQIDLLQALVQASAGKAPEAQATLQALVAKTPDFEQGWLALVNLQAASGDAAGSAATLDKALAALPKGKMLRWSKAGLMEKSGDIDGAIAIYEVLYEEDSNQAVIANNLASLLANSRTDAASLDRAYTIARRLRDADQPAFQDTYGWIAFRRGNLDEALAHLEPAAKGLPQDPTVQYHLAMTYAALKRQDEALDLLKKIQTATPPAPAALLDQVKADIAKIESAPAQGNN